MARIVWEQLQSIMKPEDLVFIDEAGSNATMVPEYAWSEVGSRVVDRRPLSRAPNISIIGALTLAGLRAIMTVLGGVGGAVFLAFVREILVPTLRPGQIVVMDNVSFHKVAGVAEAIAAAGCEVLYLPAYSPEFNPIEACGSKLEHLLRKARPGSYDEINEALAKLLDEIRPSDANGWFTHAGYRTHAQVA